MASLTKITFFKKYLLIIALSLCTNGLSTNLLATNIATFDEVVQFRKAFAPELQKTKEDLKMEYEAIALLRFVSKEVNQPILSQSTEAKLKQFGFSGALGLLRISEAVRLGYGFGSGIAILTVKPAELQIYQDSLSRIGFFMAEHHYDPETLPTVANVFTSCGDSAAIKRHVDAGNELIYGYVPHLGKKRFKLSYSKSCGKL